MDKALGFLSSPAERKRILLVETGLGYLGTVAPTHILRTLTLSRKQNKPEHQNRANKVAVADIISMHCFNILAAKVQLLHLCSQENNRCKTNLEREGRGGGEGKEKERRGEGEGKRGKRERGRLCSELSPHP